MASTFRRSAPNYSRLLAPGHSRCGSCRPCCPAQRLAQIARLVLDEIQERQQLLEGDILGNIVLGREYVATLLAQLEQSLGFAAHMVETSIGEYYLRRHAPVESQLAAK